MFSERLKSLLVATSFNYFSSVQKSCIRTKTGMVYITIGLIVAD